MKPTPLDVLRWDWVLTQRDLLTEDDFIRQAKQRGILLSPSTLEGLHRDGLLPPLLVVEMPVDDLVREARRRPLHERWMLLSGRPDTTAQGLVEEVDAGRVSLGSKTPFRPWSRRRRRLGEISFHAWEHLYSSYQLPLLKAAIEVARGRRSRGWLREWNDIQANGARRAAADSEAWIALLMALEPWYLPRLVQVTHRWSEAYEAAERAFKAQDTFAALGWTAEELRKQAENFIWQAHTMDPLRNWVELIALIHPEKWERLEGDARLALDLRQSAELILRFIEELARDGVVDRLPTPPKYSYSLLGDRLKPERADLDRVLNDYGISPHPAVVLFGEGPTEVFLFKKLMPLFGIPILDSFIRLETLGGVDKELELLAKHLAPSLRASGSDYLDMLRPPTRLLLAVDAEGRYASAEKRAKRKQQLADHLFNALDEDFQNTKTRGEMDYLVEIETWSVARDLEFSHFSDLTLARGLLAMKSVPPGKTLSELTAEVGALRQAGDPIKRVWKGWPTKGDKLELWKILWPTLRARVVRASHRGTVERIAAVRVLFHAYELAARPRRHTILPTETAPSKSGAKPRSRSRSAPTAR